MAHPNVLKESIRISRQGEFRLQACVLVIKSGGHDLFSRQLIDYTLGYLQILAVP
jgi:hypothetical protein